MANPKGSSQGNATNTDNISQNSGGQQNISVDVGTKKAKLQLLEEELNETLTAMDKNFIEQFLSSLTPDEAELQFSDSKKFLELYESRKEETLKSKISELGSKMSSLKSDIAKSETSQKSADIKSQFLKLYPDIDMEELQEFFAEHLTPAQRKELNKLPQEEAFKKLYELYQTFKGSANNTPTADGVNIDNQITQKIVGQAGDVLNKTQQQSATKSPWFNATA